MPKHIQATCFKPETCGGTCYGCTLAVCTICKCYEGSLTADCPGVVVSTDEQDKVYTANLNYTDNKGWHQDSTPIWERTANFQE